MADFESYKCKKKQEKVVREEWHVGGETELPKLRVEDAGKRSDCAYHERLSKKLDYLIAPVNVICF